MKNQSTYFLLGLMVMAMIGLTSCDDEEEAAPALPLEVQTINDLPADPTTGRDPQTGRPIASGRFTFFNFATGQVVANADSATNGWDIGLRGTTIIVNGGAARVGQGGAFIHTGLMEELAELPETMAFATDNSPTELAIPVGSGEGWYNYNPASNTITPIPGRVLVIRTGDGKYAKMEILNYYKGAPATPTQTDEARHYTFRYVYQPNGSKNF